jgi:hypothetical protein
MSDHSTSRDVVGYIKETAPLGPAGESRAIVELSHAKNRHRNDLQEIRQLLRPTGPAFVVTRIDEMLEEVEP